MIEPKKEIVLNPVSYLLLAMEINQICNSQLPRFGDRLYSNTTQFTKTVSYSQGIKIEVIRDESMDLEYGRNFLTVVIGEGEVLPRVKKRILGLLNEFPSDRNRGHVKCYVNTPALLDKPIMYVRKISGSHTTYLKQLDKVFKDDKKETTKLLHILKLIKDPVSCDTVMAALRRKIGHDALTKCYSTAKNKKGIVSKVGFYDTTISMEFIDGEMVYHTSPSKFIHTKTVREELDLFIISKTLNAKK